MPSIVVDQLPGLEGHSAVIMGDSLVVYGGKTGSKTLSPNTFCLNLTTMKWQRLTCAGVMPAPRCWHSAVVYGWRMIVFGGLLAVGVDDIHYNTFNVFANTDSLDDEVLKLRGKDRLYDPEKLRKVTQQRRESSSLFALDMKEESSWGSTSTYGSVPPTRAGHCATVYRSSMYIFGGYSVHTTARATDEEVKACYQVYSLNLDSLTWTVVDCLESVPPMRWGMSAINVSSLWVLFGGVDVTQSKEDNGVVMWDFEKGEWRWVHVDLQGSEPPPCRAMHTANRFGDQMYVFGGSGDISSMLFNDLFAFDLKSGAWTKVQTRGQPPIPRSGHTSTVVGEQLFIFGGIDHSFHRAARVWSLHLKSFEWNTVGCSYSPYDLQNVRGVGPQDDLFKVKANSASPKREPYSSIVRDMTGPNPGISQGVQTATQAIDGATDAIGAAWGGTTASGLGYEHVGTHSPGWGAANAKHLKALDLNQRVGSNPVPTEQLVSPHQGDPMSPESRTHTYPVAWSSDAEHLHSMRQNIAQTKTVLGNMVDAAAARAERETYGAGPAWGTQASPERRNRAEIQGDVARENIEREVDARLTRLKDLTQTAGQGDGLSGVPGTTYSTAQHYWKQELNTLSEQHELFRQATQRYNALEDVYDRTEDRSVPKDPMAQFGGAGLPASGDGGTINNAGSPPGRRMRINPTGPSPGAQHKSMSHESESAMFPHSVSMIPPAGGTSSAAVISGSSNKNSSNHIHDPNHPRYEGVKFSKPKKSAFVSPSIAKLGLKDQLGKHRMVTKAAPTDLAPMAGKSNFDMQLPGQGTGSFGASSLLSGASPPGVTGAGTQALPAGSPPRSGGSPYQPVGAGHNSPAVGTPSPRRY